MTGAPSLKPLSARFRGGVFLPSSLAGRGKGWGQNRTASKCKQNTVIKLKKIVIYLTHIS